MELKKHQGFTLIELLVVVAIISLLSSVVMASLNSSRQKAKISKAKSEVRTLFQALLRYNIDNNNWPAGPNNGNFWNTAEWNDPWKTGYIDTVITNDPWGSPYVFDGSPDVECLPGNSAVCSAGPNNSFDSWNRADMTPQLDDICIYFEPKC